MQSRAAASLKPLLTRGPATPQGLAHLSGCARRWGGRNHSTSGLTSTSGWPTCLAVHGAENSTAHIGNPYFPSGWPTCLAVHGAGVVQEALAPDQVTVQPPQLHQHLQPPHARLGLPVLLVRRRRRRVRRGAALMERLRLRTGCRACGAESWCRCRRFERCPAAKMVFACSAAGPLQGAAHCQSA